MAIGFAAAQARACISKSSPAKTCVIRCWRSRRTSMLKCGLASGRAAIARMSPCIGFSSMIPQVERGSPTRAASCRVSTVSSPASPGATIFGPPENPAKKCGSTKPVVIRRSASSQWRQSRVGTPLPLSPRSTRDESSRASWLITRQAPRISSPSIARSSASVFARWVPVAIRMVTSSGRTTPSSSRNTAPIISRRGCARVTSQTEIAAVCPGLASCRSGGPATGARSAAVRTASGSASDGAWTGSMTVVRSRGTSISRPLRP